MAIHVPSLGEEYFQQNSLAMHMGLGFDGDEMGLALQLEVFEMDVPVQRELMLAIAFTMMERTTRGFTGVFNICQVEPGPGTAIWVSL